jgi:hypothetical protein
MGGRLLVQMGAKLGRSTAAECDRVGLRDNRGPSPRRSSLSLRFGRLGLFCEQRRQVDDYSQWPWGIVVSH